MTSPSNQPTHYSDYAGPGFMTPTLLPIADLTNRSPPRPTRISTREVIGHSPPIPISPGPSETKSGTMSVTSVSLTESEVNLLYAIKQMNEDEKQSSCLIHCGRVVVSLTYARTNPRSGLYVHDGGQGPSSPRDSPLGDDPYI